MTWAPGRITEAWTETPGTRSLVIDIPHWPGHIAGQHVDVRLTAEDGYTAVRSYSIASSSTSKRLEITVDKLADGEVSPYLVDVAEVGDMVEIRGPAGGWFIWRQHAGARAGDGENMRPVQLIGGGSGIVPLMSMIRSHGDAHSAAPFRLLYSVRTPERALFRDELVRRAAEDAPLEVTWNFSRATPAGWPTPPERLDREHVMASVFAPAERAAVYVCGSTPFVETVANWLVDAGYDAADIKTERFGGVVPA
ncbi:FAD-binding oxidoreductase [Marisediminicola senii]|uniref:FAD-binding oxidoreductase n=1 Tax=Marisediminicola senii TaxID=2711233 RepID=UPI001913F859|nr:FAD-binding oxidoreductase [Marisediminicola senii]